MAFSFSVANGIYQNTVYGLAAKLPFKYTGAVVLGSVSNTEILCAPARSRIFNNSVTLQISCNNFTEFKWNNCGIDQHNVDYYGAKPPNCGYLLFHYGTIHPASLFRYVFCITAKCKFNLNK